jgi:hypothetical protein
MDFNRDDIMEVLIPYLDKSSIIEDQYYLINENIGIDINLKNNESQFPSIELIPYGQYTFEFYDNHLKTKDDDSEVPWTTEYTDYKDIDYIKVYKEKIEVLKILNKVDPIKATVRKALSNMEKGVIKRIQEKNNAKDI